MQCMHHLHKAVPDLTCQPRFTIRPSGKDAPLTAGRECGYVRARWHGGLWQLHASHVGHGPLWLALTASSHIILELTPHSIRRRRAPSPFPTTALQALANPFPSIAF